MNVYLARRHTVSPCRISVRPGFAPADPDMSAWQISYGEPLPATETFVKSNSRLTEAGQLPHKKMATAVSMASVGYGKTVVRDEEANGTHIVSRITRPSRIIITSSIVAIRWPHEARFRRIWATEAVAIISAMKAVIIRPVETRSRFLPFAPRRRRIRLRHGWIGSIISVWSGRAETVICWLTIQFTELGYNRKCFIS